MKVIKVVIINFHPVVNNILTSFDLVLEVSNKDPDNDMVPFGKILECLGVCWVAENWDILIIDVEKVLNMFTIIVD